MKSPKKKKESSPSSSKDNQHLIPCLLDANSLIVYYIELAQQGYVFLKHLMGPSCKIVDLRITNIQYIEVLNHFYEGCRKDENNPNAERAREGRVKRFSNRFRDKIEWLKDSHFDHLDVFDAITKVPPPLVKKKLPNNKKITTKDPCNGADTVMLLALYDLNKRRRHKGYIISFDEHVQKVCEYMGLNYINLKTMKDRNDIPPLFFKEELTHRDGIRHETESFQANYYKEKKKIGNSNLIDLSKSGVKVNRILRLKEDEDIEIEVIHHNENTIRHRSRGRVQWLKPKTAGIALTNPFPDSIVEFVKNNMRTHLAARIN